MIQIWQRRNCFLGTTQQYYTPAIDTYPLKNGGWETLLSFWVPAYFQGLLLLALGRVTSTLRLFLCQTNHHFFLSQLICRMILPFPFVFFSFLLVKLSEIFQLANAPWKPLGCWWELKNHTVPGYIRRLTCILSLVVLLRDWVLKGKTTGMTFNPQKRSCTRSDDLIFIYIYMSSCMLPFV